MAPRKKKAAEKSVSSASAKNYSVLIAPSITEKTSAIGNGGNTVVFRVHTHASKGEVKAAVEKIFNKQVAKVRTTNYLGKPRRKGQAVGRTPSYKKAFVTLKDGQTIDIVEGL